MLCYKYILFDLNTFLINKSAPRVGIHKPYILKIDTYYGEL